MRDDIDARALRYMDDVISTLEAMKGDFPAKAREIVSVLAGARDSGRRVYVMGNGGSASTASHMASDLGKGASRKDASRFRAIALTDSIPAMLAWANDSSYADIFVEQLANHLEPGDVVIGISGSGNSENVIKAIEYSNGAGAVTIGLSGFDGGRLAKAAKVGYVVPSRCMQQVEDVHLIIEHLISMALRDSPECAGKR